METILVHACCGPCSTVAVPWFRAAGFEPLAYFANPNIQPPDEHARRLEAMRRFARALDAVLLKQQRRETDHRVDQSEAAEYPAADR